MSNARLAFKRFITLAKVDPEVSSKLRMVNGAQAGWGAEEMVDPNAQYWSDLDVLVSDGGLTPPQVQVIWMLVENIDYSGGFPQKADTLSQQMEVILQIVRAKYPNAKIAFLSSRIYGGYTKKAHGTEPLAYRWLP